MERITSGNENYWSIDGRNCGETAYSRLAAIVDILGDEYSLDRLRDLVEADKAGRCAILPCKVGDAVYVVGNGKIVAATVQEARLDNLRDITFWVTFECDKKCNGCPFDSWSESEAGDWSCGGEYEDGEIKQSEFGKTVFRTREEAEAALKKMKEKLF